MATMTNSVSLLSMEDAKRFKDAVLKAISNNLTKEEKLEKERELKRMRKSYNAICDFWKD